MILKGIKKASKLVFQGDGSKLYKVAFWILVSIFVLQALFPVYWLFMSSVKPPSELYSRIQHLIPRSIDLSPYIIKIWKFMDFERYLLNSVIISGSTTIIILFAGSLAGYVFGRARLKGKMIIMLTILGLSMFPQVSFLFPLFEMFSRWGLLDTHLAMILPDSAYLLPIAVWALQAFYKQIPQDLEKAARVEGCTRIEALWKVIVPLALPGFISVGLMTFIMTYNEFFFSNLFSHTKASQPAPIGIFRFAVGYYQPWDLVTAASVVSMIPILLVILLAQKQIIRGLVARSRE